MIQRETKGRQNLSATIEVADFANQEEREPGQKEAVTVNKEAYDALDLGTILWNRRFRTDCDTFSPNSYISRKLKYPVGIKKDKII
jgi:hypothetical protein